MSVRLRTFEERDYWVSAFRVFVRMNPDSITCFPDAMYWADSALQYRRGLQGKADAAYARYCQEDGPNFTTGL